jgi:hypothetical protein
VRHELSDDELVLIGQALVEVRRRRIKGIGQLREGVDAGHQRGMVPMAGVWQGVHGPNLLEDAQPTMPRRSG